MKKEPKRKAAAEPKPEPISELETVKLPIPLVLAAASCSSTEETRYYLNGVFLHSKEGAVRIVATDGHRLFIASHKPELEEGQKLPSWLEDGIIVPNLMLKERLRLIGKVVEKFQTVEVSYAAGAPKVLLSDIVGECTFKVQPVAGTFPDYQKLIGGFAGAFDPGSRSDFEPVGFQGPYLKAVGEIAKTLEAGNVGIYASKADEAAIVTFQGCPGVVLYLMPTRFDDVMPADTVRILQPAIKLSIAALKAHETRNLDAARKARTSAEREELKRRAAEFRARIELVMQRANPRPALPKPEAPAPEEAPALPPPSEMPKANGAEVAAAA